MICQGMMFYRASAWRSEISLPIEQDISCDGHFHVGAMLLHPVLAGRP
jgi:hypothetical protein